jgi:energy-coupling factor transport system permease protein
MRPLHPLAWWGWALGVAAATTLAPTPLVVACLLGAAVAVVLHFRDDSPWARAFDSYLVLGAAIVVIRVTFYVVVGLKVAGPVLLDLPRVDLPSWAAGVDLFGPVTSTGLLNAAAAGFQLAALVVCFGAANALTNPKRALRSLPASMHHLGTAVVIGVSVTPALVTSAMNVRRAQRLRGTAVRGLRGLAACTVPVLTDALDRSLALASSMDSRGFARTLPEGSGRGVAGLLLGALLGAALGVYGLLGGMSPAAGAALLSGGAVAAVAGSHLAGRRVHRTRYRPDRWGGLETRVALSGAAVLGLLVVLPGLSPDAGMWVAGGCLVLAAGPLLLVRGAAT